MGRPGTRRRPRILIQTIHEFVRRARGLLQVRLGDIERDPHARPWLLRLIVLRDEPPASAAGGRDVRTAVGLIGFHGRPDEHGRAEVGYEVFVPFRRQGYAREAVAGLLDWAARRHGVRTFLASIAPDNEPSMRLALGMGFKQVGAQVDEADGLELVYELAGVLEGR